MRSDDLSARKFSERQNHRRNDSSETYCQESRTKMIFCTFFQNPAKALNLRNPHQQYVSAISVPLSTGLFFIFRRRQSLKTNVLDSLKNC